MGDQVAEGIKASYLSLRDAGSSSKMDRTLREEYGVILSASESPRSTLT